MPPQVEPPSRRPYSCRHCSCTYTRKENLRRHEKKHTHPKIVCPVCSKHYSRADVLKMHMSTAHAGEPFADKNAVLLSAKPATESPQVGFRSMALAGGGPPAADTAPAAGDSPLQSLPSGEIDALLIQYWESFHPTFPILHRATFRLPAHYASDPVTHIMCAIGAKYTPARHQLAAHCFAYCMNFLNHNLYVSDTHAVPIETYQAGLLAGYAGLFWGSSDWYKWASRIVYELILVGREIGMFQDSPATAEEARSSWSSFVALEQTRRASYALFFIDGQMSTLLNNPPKMSHYEIKHILPCADELWAAASEAEWRALSAKVQVPVLPPIVGHFSLGNMLKPAGPDTRSFRSPGVYFLEALQKTLISGTAPPQTSSFGGMILLVAVHIMIRNMTQFAGILETYFALAQDPYSRRNQLGNAVNGLRFLIPRSRKGHAKSMWGLFEVTLNLALIHLHLPDTAITCGIVEPDLQATVATAAALTQPQSVVPPGTAFLGNDYRQFPYETLALVTGHAAFFLKTFASEACETNPSLTYMFYKVTLVTWSVLNSLIFQAQSAVACNRREAAGSAQTPDAKELQKEFMFKHLAVDILSHVDESSSFDDIKCYERWTEKKLRAYDVWGVGPCGAGSFNDMLRIGDTL